MEIHNMMNLMKNYGPTMTLKELCDVLKVSRSFYYTSTDPLSPTFKEGFPKRLPDFSRVMFLTSSVEEYLVVH